MVGRPQVAEHLGKVLICQRFAGFEFDNQAILHEQVGKVIPQNRSILIGDLEGALLNNMQTQLAQSVCEAVFINFLQVAVPQISVQGESSFTDFITENFDVFVWFHVGKY